MDLHLELVLGSQKFLVGDSILESTQFFEGYRKEVSRVGASTFYADTEDARVLEVVVEGFDLINEVVPLDKAVSSVLAVVRVTEQ